MDTALRAIEIEARVSLNVEYSNSTDLMELSVDTTLLKASLTSYFPNLYFKIHYGAVEFPVLNIDVLQLQSVKLDIDSLSSKTNYGMFK